MTNPILEELYEARRQLQSQHGENPAEFLRTEFERLKASGHPIAEIQQRRIKVQGKSMSDAKTIGA